jgi:hypothetical protein
MNGNQQMSQPLCNLLESLRGRALVCTPSATLSTPFRLGDILVASGQITRVQLETSLEQQKHSVRKIGELLVESGCAELKQVNQGLRLQHMLVSVALGTALVLSAPATSGAGGTSAGLIVTASVKKTARIAVLQQQTMIHITREDVAQGYLEVSAVSRVEVKNSSMAGYMLAFKVQEESIRDVIVKGLGNEVQISFGNGWVLRPYSRRPEIIELSYRFILAADTRPGNYPWPVQISAMAI